MGKCKTSRVLLARIEDVVAAGGEMPAITAFNQQLSTVCQPVDRLLSIDLKSPLWFDDFLTELKKIRRRTCKPLEVISALYSTQEASLAQLQSLPWLEQMDLTSYLFTSQLTPKMRMLPIGPQQPNSIAYLRSKTDKDVLLKCVNPCEGFGFAKTLLENTPHNFRTSVPIGPVTVVEWTDLMKIAEGSSFVSTALGYLDGGKVLDESKGEILQEGEIYNLVFGSVPFTDVILQGGGILEAGRLKIDRIRATASRVNFTCG